MWTPNAMRILENNLSLLLICFIILSCATTLSTTKCSLTLNTRTGIISSLLNKTCEWRIVALPDERIVLNITNLNIEKSSGCNLGYVEVRDGLWFNSPSLGKFCGNDTFLPITSTTNNVLITYVSQSGEFTANYEAICGENFYMSNNETILKSPNFPENYPRNKKCVWKIITPETRHAVLNFQSFDLEDHTNCLYDYVEVRDGFTKESNLIGVYCGNTVPSEIISSTNLLLVTFMSDATVQRSGFSVIATHTNYNICASINHGCAHRCISNANEYKCECNDGYVLDSNRKNCKEICGGSFNATNGRITSPNYPGTYPLNLTCVYEIAKVPDNRMMKLQFNYLNLEGESPRCDFDSVEIFSMFGKKLKSHGVYCGSKIPKPILSKRGMKIFFRSDSDSSFSRNGFVIDFKSDVDRCRINKGNCRHACLNTFESRQCVCYGYKSVQINDGRDCQEGCKYEISSSSGVITSPNFPNLYPFNADCKWLITTVPGNRIRVSFSFVRIEKSQNCTYDKIEIYDGFSVGNKSLGTICGLLGELSKTVNSSNNELSMTFRSDGSIIYEGFNATYTTFCGGIYTADVTDNYIYSHPEFGNSVYNDKTDCEWTITSSNGYHTVLSFLTFDLETSPNCTYDYLEIFVGSNASAPSAGKFCGKDVPADLVGVQYFIRFHSDASKRYEGFSMTYRAVAKIKNY